MKFGINFFPSFRATDCSTSEYYAQCLRLAERADQLGFNSVKTVEHYFFDYGGHSPIQSFFSPQSRPGRGASGSSRERSYPRSIIP